MKRIYLSLMMLLGALTAVADYVTTDYEYTFQVYIPNPTYFKLTTNEGDVTLTTAGTYTISGYYHETKNNGVYAYSYFDSVTLSIKDDYRDYFNIASCTVTNASSTTDYSGPTYPTTSLSLTSYLTWNSSNTTYTFTPTLLNLNDARTASATVIVDDASKMSLRCGSGSYSPVLANGTNTVYFNPSTEYNWTIGPATYSGAALQSVELNGTSQELAYGNYYNFDVANGNTVNVVTTAAGTSTYSVSFSFTNPGTQGVVTGVYPWVNYTKGDLYADWQSGLNLDPSSQIVVDVDRENFDITSFKVNGEEQVSGSYLPTSNFITITKNTTVAITATPFGDNTVSFIMDSPASVNVSKAESQYGSSFLMDDLEAGTHDVAISSKMKYLIISAKDGECTVDRVAYKNASEANYTEVSDSYGTYYVPIEDGMSVIINSHAITRTDLVRLYIKNISKINNLFIQNQNSKYFVSTYGYDGSIVPATGWQEFYVDKSADSTLTLYFSQESYSDPKTVIFNGEPVEAQYGYYYLDLDPALATNIIKVYPSTTFDDYTTSVEAVSVESPSTGVMYDLMGRKINANAPVAPGIYIVNGKKVIR